MARLKQRASVGTPLSSSRSSAVPFLLVHGFELAISFALVVVAVVFTLFPEALTHTPIGFEDRGFLHHVFHYMLLTGALATLLGLAFAQPKIELAGLCLLIGALFINLLAIATLGAGYSQQGFALALRAGVIVGLGARAFLLGVYLPRLKG